MAIEIKDRLIPEDESLLPYIISGKHVEYSEEDIENLKERIGESGGGSGEKGEKGDKGEDGKSAYQIAVDNGFEGTETEWLASLKGEQGETGPQGEQGVRGADGKSAYEVAVENGFEGTEEEWLESLKGSGEGGAGEKGDKGDKGDTGADGKSAYQIAVENGFEGSETEWLASLKGETGPQGEKGDKGDTGEKGETGDKGEKGDTGEKGEKGDKGDTGEQGEKGDTGEAGPQGEDGKSAYQIAVDNGFEGSETEWLASLKGEKGDKGDAGEGSNVPVYIPSYTIIDGAVTITFTNANDPNDVIVIPTIEAMGTRKTLNWNVKLFGDIDNGEWKSKEVKGVELAPDIDGYSRIIIKLEGDGSNGLDAFPKINVEAMTNCEWICQFSTNGVDYSEFKTISGTDAIVSSADTNLIMYSGSDFKIDNNHEAYKYFIRILVKNTDTEGDNVYLTSGKADYNTPNTVNELLFNNIDANMETLVDMCNIQNNEEDLDVRMLIMKPYNASDKTLALDILHNNQTLTKDFSLPVTISRFQNGKLIDSEQKQWYRLYSIFGQQYGELAGNKYVSFDSVKLEFTLPAGYTLKSFYRNKNEYGNIVRPTYGENDTLSSGSVWSETDIDLGYGTLYHESNQYINPFGGRAKLQLTMLATPFNNWKNGKPLEVTITLDGNYQTSMGWTNEIFLTLNKEDFIQLDSKTYAYSNVIEVDTVYGFNVVVKSEPPTQKLESGYYVIRQQSSGKWLNAGGNWATNSILDDAPREVYIYHVDREMYTIDTEMYSNSSKHYLGSNGYWDNTAYQFKLHYDDDKNGWIMYTGGGNAATFNNVGLSFLSPDNRDYIDIIKVEDLKNEFIVNADTYSIDNPHNISWLIKGGDFNYFSNDIQKWQRGANTGKIGAAVESSFPYLNNGNFEKWDSGSDYISQIISDIPNGLYKVKFNGYYRAGDIGTINYTQTYSDNARCEINNKVVGYVKNVGSESSWNSAYWAKGYYNGRYTPNSQTEAAYAFGMGKYLNEFIFEVTDNQIELKVIKDGIYHDWLVLDNFRLEWLGSDVNQYTGSTLDVEVSNAADYEEDIPLDFIGNTLTINLKTRFYETFTPGLNTTVEVTIGDETQTQTSEANFNSMVFSNIEKPATAHIRVSIPREDVTLGTDSFDMVEGYAGGVNIIKPMVLDEVENQTYTVRLKSDAHDDMESILLYDANDNGFPCSVTYTEPAEYEGDPDVDVFEWNGLTSVDRIVITTKSEHLMGVMMLNWEWESVPDEPEPDPDEPEPDPEPAGDIEVGDIGVGGQSIELQPHQSANYNVSWSSDGEIAQYDGFTDFLIRTNDENILVNDIAIDEEEYATDDYVHTYLAGRSFFSPYEEINGSVRFKITNDSEDTRTITFNVDVSWSQFEPEPDPDDGGDDGGDDYEDNPDEGDYEEPEEGE